VMEELLAQLSSIERVPGQASVKACYPTGGFSSLPLRIVRA